MKLIFAVLLGVACMAGSLNAGITGRVVDQSGNGVFDAMICYTNLANRLIYVYSDANGNFFLPGPSEWKLDDLPMYKPVPTNTKANFSAKPSHPSFSARVNGDLVVFTVTGVNQRVTVDLFDVTGKKVMRVFDKVLAQSGNHAFSPFLNNGKAISGQLYVLRLSDGRNTVSLRVINTGANTLAGMLRTSDQVVQMDNVQHAAQTTANNTIRAGKTGYLAATAAIGTNYDDNVGNITIKKLDIEARVDSIMTGLNMTRDEKLGQLLQPNYSGTAGQGDVTNYKLGSFLKGEGAAGYITAAQQTRLKIPLIIGNDMVHGGRHVYFPHNIGLGCSGDTLLVELAYRIYALNCIPLYNNLNFAPCLDVHRNYKSGRVYESFGENPDIVSKMARASVRGTQGTDLTSPYTMLVSLKHWAAAGGSNDGKTGSSGECPENTSAPMATLAKIHFPPFVAALKAGAGCVMTAYPQVWGTCMSVHKELITDTLKGNMKFDGFVLTDWATSAGKELQSLNAGNDMLMTINPSGFAAKVSGLSDTRLNDAVRRILRVKFRMGLFENPSPETQLNNYVSSKEYRDVARACVRKSIVLLKNDAVNGTKPLPISKTAKVHVVGAYANNMGVQCGGWSASKQNNVSSTSNSLTGGDEGWQGNVVDGASISGSTTILGGIRSIISGAGHSATETGIPSDVDVVIVVVGETPYAEQPGDRSTIDLASDQIALVQAVRNKVGASKPVITILLTGRPNALGSIPNNSNALVAAWLPGTEGNGVSDVLFGDYDFVGKLSFTWPANNAQNPIHAGNLGDVTGSGGTPLYAYGHGLTYN